MSRSLSLTKGDSLRTEAEAETHLSGRAQDQEDTEALPVSRGHLENKDRSREDPEENLKRLSSYPNRLFNTESHPKSHFYLTRSNVFFHHEE